MSCAGSSRARNTLRCRDAGKRRYRIDSQPYSDRVLYPGTYVIREQVDLTKRSVRFKEGLPLFLFGVAVGMILMAMMV